MPLNLNNVTPRPGLPRRMSKETAVKGARRGIIRGSSSSIAAMSHWRSVHGQLLALSTVVSCLQLFCFTVGKETQPANTKAISVSVPHEQQIADTGLEPTA